MNKPYKLIWKFKNNNRYNQYHIYIFVGNKYPELYDIYDNIQNLNFFETLIKIKKEDIKKLEDVYGSKWYKYFFNMYHLGYIISQIQNNKEMKLDLVNKYGENWVNDHIELFEWNNKKILYSYNSIIKTEYERKDEFKLKTRRLIAKTHDDDDDETKFKISTNVSIDDILELKKNRKTGHINKSISKGMNNHVKIQNSDIVSSELKLLSTESENIHTIHNGGRNINTGLFYDWSSNRYYKLNEISFKTHTNINGISVPKSNRLRYDTIPDNADISRYSDEGKMISQNGGNDDTNIDIDDDIDLTNIEQLYNVDNIDVSELKKTDMMIQKAINNKILKKNNNTMIKFNKEKDNLIYKENLKNVYTKFYVKSQYIYEDDTINTIKDKICVSLYNNDKFGDILYLTRNRQYLWCEYIYNNDINKVMLGQKWLHKNELLDIDIEPDNRMYIYEQLKDKLKVLNFRFNRYGNKIRREENNNYIIHDYNNYITNNDIYMIDIYNELGKKYSPSNVIIQNLMSVYIKIYFPKIHLNDMIDIIDYLNNNKKVEANRIDTIYNTINNDLILENEIMNVANELKDKIKYNEPYITQTIIHVYLNNEKGKYIDMYRLFNNFKTTKQYPYIQYHTIDKGSDYKYNEKEIHNYIKDVDNLDILYKWFENEPFGINIKIKNIDKSSSFIKNYININISDSGRIEYRNVWHESDKTTINDIKKTYTYIIELIEKINNENSMLKLRIPREDDFKYAFINTIQKFSLPDKHIINHNDLSDFARYFYPYIALVLEPRKRQSKEKDVSNKSKYGTYLRYKRISNYENVEKIKHRIIHYIRNYEFTDKNLALELSKQFNITYEKSLGYINDVRKLYPKLKKNRKYLKKLENLPKYKTPGIDVAIQGRHRDNYVVRISGARDKNQLLQITNFINIFLQLYIETYILKKPNRQILKEKLRTLTHIAKRRNKVDLFIDYTQETKIVKEMAKQDKQRLGFKPEKGQNQWTRSCQNSGNDKKRRPQQYNVKSIKELIKKGYTYNKKQDIYEKTIKYNKKNIVIKTIKLPEYDDNGMATGKYIHYACNPEDNGAHMYIGFLTKSKNPFGHCMPCCYKKDPFISNNKVIKAFHENCMGKNIKENKDIIKHKSTGDILYILQDTYKIQNGRIGYLPTFINIYFNDMLDKSKKIKNHYLDYTTGYFFKRGVEQNDYYFLNAIGIIFNKTINNIRKIIINSIENDNNNQIFTSLNNGDIRTRFVERKRYIKYIEQSKFLDYMMVKDILCLPGIITKHGLNIIIFHKKQIKTSDKLEKDKYIDDFYIDVSNSNNCFTNNNPKYGTIFLIKEDKRYYPISLITKTDKNTKDIVIQDIFHIDNSKYNIVNHVNKFYNKNCDIYRNSIQMTNINKTANETSIILENIGNEYIPKRQVIDLRYKCKYIITNGGMIIPVKPSGTIWNLRIIDNYEKYINDFDTTFKYLLALYSKSKKYLPLKPVGVYYISKNDNTIVINAIMTKSKYTVPVSDTKKKISDIVNKNLSMEKKTLYDDIDNEIKKGADNYIIDDRILQVTENIFVEESYNLFRLEFSNYLDNTDNIQLKQRIKNIMNSKNDKKQKINKIRLLLYKIIDTKLYKKYIELININDNEEKEQTGGNTNNNIKRRKALKRLYYIIDTKQTGGKVNKLIHKINNLSSLVKYKINNDRKTCNTHTNNEQCINNPHCRWVYNDCYMSLTNEMIVMFVNRISEELVENSFKAYEIMKFDNYYVSDIVDRNDFTYTPGQKIIRSSSSNIKYILQNMFGKDNIPIIGKKRRHKIDTNIDELNNEYELIDIGDIYIQRIIHNNNTIFRAYANGYYWINSDEHITDIRNLKYHSKIQTDISNKLRVLFIEWIQDNKNNISTKMKKEMGIFNDNPNSIDNYISKIYSEQNTISNGIVEYMVLSKIYNNIPIIIRSKLNEIIHIFDSGEHITNPSSLISKKYDPKKGINMRFQYNGNMSIPDIIDVIYYK